MKCSSVLHHLIVCMCGCVGVCCVYVMCRCIVAMCGDVTVGIIYMLHYIGIPRLRHACRLIEHIVNEEHGVNGALHHLGDGRGHMTDVVQIINCVEVIAEKVTLETCTLCVEHGLFKSSL